MMVVSTPSLHFSAFSAALCGEIPLPFAGGSRRPGSSILSPVRFTSPAALVRSGAVAGSPGGSASSFAPSDFFQVFQHLEL